MPHPSSQDASRPPLSPEQLRLIDAWWRAANYLSVGQIYLLDNPLLREKLAPAHIKPRLLGHFGTTPGLNFIYVHLNRIIKAHDCECFSSPGLGMAHPASLPNTWLEGTYSETYPDISRDEEGMRRLFRQFSFPGASRSHAAPEHRVQFTKEASSATRFPCVWRGARQPDLIVACVVGDGEAETGPLATSWHCNKFLNAASDGAVLPILHLNGYKIANPTVLARIPAPGTRGFAPGLWLCTAFRRGRRARADASGDGGHARCGHLRDPGYPARGAAGPAEQTAALAHDRASLAERLDRAEDGRRSQDRGLLARSPGSNSGHEDARPHPAARGLDAQLPAGRVVRRAGRRCAPRSARWLPKARGG